MEKSVKAKAEPKEAEETITVVKDKRETKSEEVEAKVESKTGETETEKKTKEESFKVSEVKEIEEESMPDKTTVKTEEDFQKAGTDINKSYEEMTVEELQEAILEKMRKNGPVTEYMLGTVRDNTHHGSLINWVKSFR